MSHSLPFDGRLVGRHHLKGTPQHALADGDGILLGDRTTLINIGRLDLANTHDVGPKLESLLLEMCSCLLRRSEDMTFWRYGPLESGSDSF